MTISFDDFLQVDIRIGTIVEAGSNAAALKALLPSPGRLRPRDRPQGELGPAGPELWRRRAERPGQAAAVVNFPPRQIAKVVSEVLVLGFPDEAGNVVLVAVERPVPNGGRLY